MIINSFICQENWQDIARNKQKLPDGDWFVWMILAGRGFGKTRTGAESVMQLVESGQYKNIAIIGKTMQETRRIMVEGISGIMSSTLAADKNVAYYPSRHELIWQNGAKATLISGDNYESIRGLQFDLVWIDEFAKFERPADLWEQVTLALRLGDNPRCIITTTPRNRDIIKKLANSNFVHVTNGSTYENKANLSSKFIDNIANLIPDGRFIRQELYGEIVSDSDSLVWRPNSIKYRKIERAMLQRVVIAVDPAVTKNKKSDETGIVVVGEGLDNKLYVLEDLSGRYTTENWAQTVAAAFKTYGASRVVAEINNGGDMVENILRTACPHIPFSAIRAIHGKIARAEPVALLYSAGRVFHCQKFDKLEEQISSMSYEDEIQHDDRLDALVWGITELANHSEPNASIITL